MNEKPKPVGTPNMELKLPIIVYRDDCWFFEQKCLYKKSDIEVMVEIHNELLTLGDYEKYNSVFECPYSLEIIYVIPTPDGPWCERCMQAIGMREESDLGYGKPRRKEVNDKK